MNRTRSTGHNWEGLIRKKLPAGLHGFVIALLLDQRLTTACNVIRIEGFFIQGEPLIECYFYPIQGPELYRLVDLSPEAFEGVITPEKEFRIKIDLEGETLSFCYVNSVLPQSTNTDQPEL